MTLQEIQYKAQAIMQKWRDEDSAPYIEFVEELALMDVSELPEGLEEAAKKFVGYDMDCDELRDYEIGIAAFIAGAEWQKAKMLEGAVEIEVKEDAGGFPIVPLDAIELYDYENDKPLAKAGDKIRVIVIKEDEK